MRPASSSEPSLERRLLIVACSGAALLGLSLAAAARADVLLDGNQSEAAVGTGGNPSAPWLVTLDQTVTPYPYWVTAWLDDPTSLSGEQVLSAQGTATFRDPFDDSEPFDPIPVAFTADATARAGYEVSGGQLHAWASATAFLTPSSYTAVAPDARPPVEIVTPFFPGGYGGIGILYREEIAFTSATLPVGSPIQVEVTVHHVGTTSSVPGVGGGPPYPNHALSESRLTLGVYDENWVNKGLGADPLSLQRDEVIAGTVVQTSPSHLDYSFDIEVGDHFYLQHGLKVWARAAADALNSQAGSIADVAAGVTIRSLTPGVSIESGSGHDYTVPEPGTALLQTAALLALAGLARRSRREHTAARPRPGE